MRVLQESLFDMYGVHLGVTGLALPSRGDTIAKKAIYMTAIIQAMLRSDVILFAVVRLITSNLYR